MSMPDMSGFARLRPRQHRAVEALLREPTIARAAGAAQVSERTLRRWLQREDFRAAYERVCREALRAALAGLQAAAGEAVQALREVMGDADARPAERVSAARVALDFALRGAELLDFEERIAVLEAAVGGAAGRVQ